MIYCKIKTFDKGITVAYEDLATLKKALSEEFVQVFTDDDQFLLIPKREIAEIEVKIVDGEEDEQ